MGRSERRDSPSNVQGSGKAMPRPGGGRAAMQRSAPTIQFLTADGAYTNATTCRRFATSLIIGYELEKWHTERQNEAMASARPAATIVVNRRLSQRGAGSGLGKQDEPPAEQATKHGRVTAAPPELSRQTRRREAAVILTRPYGEREQTRPGGQRDIRTARPEIKPAERHVEGDAE